MRKWLLLLLCPLCLSISSFKDNQSFRYKKINDRVIERQSDGAKYQIGMINVKFKQQNSSFTGLTTGFSSIDNLLTQHNVTRVYQIFPLNADISKRMPGDDDISRIFRIKYSAHIDPSELSEEILESNRDMG